MKYIVIAIIVLLAVFLLKKNANRQERPMEETWGEIESILQGERATVNYFVRLTVDGVSCRAKSVTYRHGTKDLHVGDRVRVKYYTNDAGNVRVLGQHPDLKKC